MVHAKWHTSRGRMGMKDPPCKPGGGAPGVARRCEHARQSWWGRSDVKGQDQNSEEAEEKCAWGALHEVVHTASHLLLSVLRALHVRWHSCLPADQSPCAIGTTSPLSRTEHCRSPWRSGFWGASNWQGGPSSPDSMHEHAAHASGGLGTGARWQALLGRRVLRHSSYRHAQGRAARPGRRCRMEP